MQQSDEGFFRGSESGEISGLKGNPVKGTEESDNGKNLDMNSRLGYTRETTQPGS